MEIILARHCKSLKGTISKRHGYAIRQKGMRFYGVRNTRRIVPSDGHLRFIFDCAEMTRSGFLIADIRVMGEELIAAANEAGLTFDTILPDVEYNAHDILNIKTYYGL